jgi:AraC-like DNA-binding protein
VSISEKFFKINDFRAILVKWLTKNQRRTIIQPKIVKRHAEIQMKGEPLMTNTTQIRAYIESQGLKLGHVARVLGISSSALHQKLNDESDFKVSEADRLSAMLGLTMEQRDACFFGPGTRMCQRKGAA